MHGLAARPPVDHLCVYVRVYVRAFTGVCVCVYVSLCAETNFSSGENNIVQDEEKV